MKKILASVLAIVLVLSLLSVVSCKKRANPNGPVDSVPATATATPNVTFSVYTYVSGTAISGIKLDMNSVNCPLAIPLSATSQTAGGATKAQFQLNCGGKWYLTLEAQGAYQQTIFAINNPVGVTCYVLDIGNQNINITSGNLTANQGVPATQYSYTITYTSPVPKLQTLSVVGLPADITVTAIPSNQQVINGNDTVTYIFTIPNSYEDGYTNNNITFNFLAYDTAHDVTLSTVPATITKNWECILSAETSFMPIYDYGDNHNSPSYYIGLNNIMINTIEGYITVGAVTYTYVTSGALDNSFPVSGISAGTNPPGFSGFGNFEIVSKMETDNLGINRSYSFDSNNGYLIIRAQDQGSLNITRTFYTTAGYNTTCCNYACQIPNTTPVGGTKSCGTVPPANCFLGYTAVLDQVWRMRSSLVTTYQ
jgi:hypothetical protein